MYVTILLLGGSKNGWDRRSIALVPASSIVAIPSTEKAACSRTRVLDPRGRTFNTALIPPDGTRVRLNGGRQLGELRPGERGNRPSAPQARSDVRHFASATQRRQQRGPHTSLALPCDDDTHANQT